MTWLRRLFPPVQASECVGCGLRISERRRRPCPVCGSINRVIRVGWAEAVVSQDRVS
jgi:hypothetical protein